MAKKSTAEVAENGQTAKPINEIAKATNETNAWCNSEVKDDDEAEARVGEYFNICVLKGEQPLFETLCLYLGISDETGKQYAQGTGCSSRLTKILQNALTRMKAIEGKLVYKGAIRDVPYIFRSKQYFGYREPSSKLEDLLSGNLLKELPSTQSVMQKYLEDYEDDYEQPKGAEE